MVYLMNFVISKDSNGNKTVKVSVKGHRSFSIQTLANLPSTHRKGVCAETINEVISYVGRFGTENQKKALNKA